MSEMFSDCSGLSAIYVGDGWTTDNVTSGGLMFTYCSKLVGGQGTVYDGSHTDYTYAHIDGGAENPGYFTHKSSEATAIGGLNAKAEDYDDNTPVYNLSGQRVASSKKGIYIRNGRKIVMN